MKSVILTLIFSSQLAFAHGENKHGPNGGFIRMPGTFHTEVILTDPNKLKVFLLDINWKNPTVKDSSLKVTHKEFKISEVCSPEANYFVCQFPSKVDLTKKGELVVEAERSGKKGMSVIYELPLKLQKTNNGHSGHH